MLSGGQARVEFLVVQGLTAGSHVLTDLRGALLPYGHHLQRAPLLLTGEERNQWKEGFISNKSFSVNQDMGPEINFAHPCQDHLLLSANMKQFFTTVQVFLQSISDKNITEPYFLCYM